MWNDFNKVEISETKFLTSVITTRVIQIEISFNFCIELYLYGKINNLVLKSFKKLPSKLESDCSKKKIIK